MLRAARLPHRHQRCHRRVRHNPIGAAPWRCPPLVPHLDRRRRHLRRTAKMALPGKERRRMGDALDAAPRSGLARPVS